MRRGDKFWASERDNLYDLYWNDKKTIAEVANIYGCYPKTISEQFKKLSIKIRNSAEDRYNCKHTCNIHFFDNIDSEESAYILGFILADGHVSKQGSLMISLNRNDVDILKKINDSLGSDYPITENNSGKYVSLVISSRYITNKLNEIGLAHDKTYSLDFNKVLSNIPSGLTMHFVRGMFDGDGSISIYEYSYFKKHSYHFGYTGKYDVCRYISELFGLNTKMVDEGNGIYTCVSSNHKTILSALHSMYDEASIYMDRKKKVFDEIEHICKIEHA